MSETPKFDPNDSAQLGLGGEMERQAREARLQADEIDEVLVRRHDNNLPLNPDQIKERDELQDRAVEKQEQADILSPEEGP